VRHASSSVECRCSAVNVMNLIALDHPGIVLQTGMVEAMLKVRGSSLLTFLCKCQLFHMIDVDV